MTVEADACGNCAFWLSRRVDGDLEPAEEAQAQAQPPERGECHRYPPVVLEILPADAVWPITPYGAWCGEYEPIEDPEEQEVA